MMIVSYIVGIIVIPKYIRQRKMLQVCSIAGILFTAMVVLLQGKISVWFVSLLGLLNASLWPAIWPLAIDGLGKFTKQGSALMIMGIAGGAITPLLYGMLSTHLNPQLAYIIMVPCYGFIVYYSTKGYRIGKR
jgi:MFS transporter, FHS family, L-fucose permease